MEQRTERTTGEDVAGPGPKAASQYSTETLRGGLFALSDKFHEASTEKGDREWLVGEILWAVCQAAAMPGDDMLRLIHEDLQTKDIGNLLNSLN